MHWPLEGVARSLYWYALGTGLDFGFDAAGSGVDSGMLLGSWLGPGVDFGSLSAGVGAVVGGVSGLSTSGGRSTGSGKLKYDIENYRMHVQ
jgi:hypothetical protein